MSFECCTFIQRPSKLSVIGPNAGTMLMGVCRSPPDLVSGYTLNFTLSQLTGHRNTTLAIVLSEKHVANGLKRSHRVFPSVYASPLLSFFDPHPNPNLNKQTPVPLPLPHRVLSPTPFSGSPPHAAGSHGSTQQSSPSTSGRTCT